MPEKKNWRPFVLYLLVVIIGSALAGYAGIRLSEAGVFRTRAEAQADVHGTEDGPDGTVQTGTVSGPNGPNGTDGTDQTAGNGTVQGTASGNAEEPEGGVLETPSLFEGEEEAPEEDRQNAAGLFADPDPRLVYPSSYNMAVYGFDALPFKTETLIKALGDFGYENNLTITRADYAGELKGNGRNAVSFGIMANAEPDIYITATYYKDYGRFLFLFDERTAAVAPQGQAAGGTGSASGANPYKANDLVVYDIPTDVYNMFRSEEGFRNAVYAYLTAQGIYTDTVVAGEWYEISGDSASFVLEAEGRTIQASYDAARDAYSFS